MRQSHIWAKGLGANVTRVCVTLQIRENEKKRRVLASDFLFFFLFSALHSYSILTFPHTKTWVVQNTISLLNNAWTKRSIDMKADWNRFLVRIDGWGGRAGARRCSKYWIIGISRNFPLPPLGFVKKGENRVPILRPRGPMEEIDECTHGNRQRQLSVL